MTRELDHRSMSSYSSFVLTGDVLPAFAQKDPRPLAAQALDFVALATRAAGAEDGSLPEFAAAPGLSRTPLGASAVHLTQTAQGIPVLFSQQVARFGVNDAVQRVEGRVASAPSAVFELSRSVEEAAEVAVGFLLAEDDEEPQDGTAERAPLEEFVGTVLADFPELAMRPTVLAAGPLAAPVRASLVWLPVGQRLRLCWNLFIALSDSEGIYQVVVAAGEPPLGQPAGQPEGPVFLSTQTVPSACTALVYDLSPATERVERELPQPWDTYGAAAPGLGADPPAWVSGPATEGYSNRASAKGSTGPVAASDPAGPQFAPADPLGADQQVVNAFYAACWMHDWFYAHGFREADGSFQVPGVTLTGRSCRKIVVQPSPTYVTGTACWWGVTNPPVLKLGPDAGVGGTGRHTAFDRTIIAHEYMHGVAAALVANGAEVNPFSASTESKGIYEGLADFVAVTVTGEVTIGSWLKDRPDGMREHRYDADFPSSEVHFGRVGAMSTYQVGQLWCAVLLAAGRAVGTDLAVALVLDSLRSLPSGPTLLGSRDALLLALDDRLDAAVLTNAEHAAARTALQAVFLAFGMGPGASDLDGYLPDPPDLSP